MITRLAATLPRRQRGAHWPTGAARHAHSPPCTGRPGTTRAGPRQSPACPTRNPARSHGPAPHQLEHLIQPLANATAEPARGLARPSRCSARAARVARTVSTPTRIRSAHRQSSAHRPSVTATPQLDNRVLAVCPPTSPVPGPEEPAGAVHKSAARRPRGTTIPRDAGPATGEGPYGAGKLRSDPGPARHTARRLQGAPTGGGRQGRAAVRTSRSTSRRRPSSAAARNCCSLPPACDASKRRPRRRAAEQRSCGAYAGVVGGAGRDDELEPGAGGENASALPEEEGPGGPTQPHRASARSGRSRDGTFAKGEYRGRPPSPSRWGLDHFEPLL